MSYCREHTAVNSCEHERIAVSLACRAWTCPDCAEKRKAGLIAQAIGGNPRTFLTLTIRRDDHSNPKEAARQLAHAWRCLRLRWMRRKKLKHLPFIAVFEKHKSGWPHLHILMRSGYMDQKWISAQMQDLINSPVIDIRLARNAAQCAAYCAKYCGKDPEKFGHCKRYWQSKDYDQRPPNEKQKKHPNHGTWHREDWRIQIIVEEWTIAGLAIEWRGPYVAVGRRPGGPLPASQGPPAAARPVQCGRPAGVPWPHG